MGNLTPYDTGKRLEIHPWSENGEEDRHGRFDADNEAGESVFSGYFEKAGDEYTLNLDILGDDDLKVVVEGVALANPDAADLATREVLVASLCTTDDPQAQGKLAIVGGEGGLSRITGEVYESNMMSGLVVIETEHGSIYLPATETVVVTDGP